VRMLLYEWFNLEDCDFETLTRDVLNYIHQGKIGIQLYPGIFEMFSHFSQEALIKEDIPSLIDIFKEGLKKTYESMLASYDGTQSLAVSNLFVDEKHSEQYDEIKRITEQCTSKIEESWFRKKVQEIFELIPKDIEEFSRRLLEEKEHYWSKPILKYYSMEKLIEKLEQANNKTLVNFRSLLHRRYRDILGVQDFLSEDADNLRKLSELLSLYIIGKEQKLSIELLKKIGQTAQECSEILSKDAKSTTISMEEQR